ncbi:MAG: hypothetical protein QNJ91_02975 [Gammaproteobacteria bacterium]|nr:hypothetical protein [Gammaproteobacteria bacterium]
MLLRLLDRRPLLDAAYAGWMFDVFAWAARNFDAQMFRDETVLVTPSNDHFPGRADSAQDMAQLIFDRVVAYAGMQHWPLRLLPADSCTLETAAEVRVAGGRRGSRAAAAETAPASLTVGYDPQSVNNPEAMIAVFAHTLAHYLGTSADEPPPGGVDNWPQATEILAVFLGFGLMFANTALVLPRGGCCGGPVVRRQAFVSQHDITYALAIFAALKTLPGKAVLAHLKPALRGHFRRAAREVDTRYAQRLLDIRGLYTA